MFTLFDYNINTDNVYVDFTFCPSAYGFNGYNPAYPDSYLNLRPTVNVTLDSGISTIYYINK